MRFDLDELPQIGSLASGGKSDGKPLQLLVADIDKDPKQPRQEFEAEPLQQLADSISERGLLQAISVRRHPHNPQRWMLNFGARRLRASKLAGLNQIPATVNELATSYDQVIENEQREGLKPLELALFVQSRIAMGESQADIARQMSKSAPYVTYATALIDAPDWLLTLYREGRCRGMRELHELRQLAKQHPGCVRKLPAGGGSITREVVSSLKAGCGGAAHAPTALQDPSATPAVAPEPAGSPMPVLTPARSMATALPAVPRPQPDRSTNGPVLLADLDGNTVEVLVDAVPAEDGKVYIRVPSTLARHAVDAVSLRLIRIVPSRGDH